MTHRHAAGKNKKRAPPAVVSPRRSAVVGAPSMMVTEREEGRNESLANPAMVELIAGIVPRGFFEKHSKWQQKSIRFLIIPSLQGFQKTQANEKRQLWPTSYRPEGYIYSS